MTGAIGGGPGHPARPGTRLDRDAGHGRQGTQPGLAKAGELDEQPLADPVDAEPSLELRDVRLAGPLVGGAKPLPSEAASRSAAARRSRSAASAVRSSR